MKRLLTIMVTAVMLITAFAVPMSAATTQDVTVTATPTFISISNSPGTFDFGPITASSTPNTTTDYFTITNTSTVSTDISIKVGASGWSGTSSWTYGAPGADTAKLSASAGTGLYGTSIAAVDTDYTLIAGLAATTNDSWELQLDAPTSFTYGAEQTITVTISAAAAA